MSNLTIAEVFAGIGGVTGGFLDAGGFDPVLLNDSDQSARDAFALNFPKLADRYHVSSVQHLTGPKMLSLSGHDEIGGILGCPPCQGLSPAGPRSRNDKRNELLHEMHRLIWSVGPKFFVIENVPSLLQTTLYEDFQASLGTRYAIAAAVLNAAEYGIPQLRRRAVILGFRLDLDVIPSFPAPTHGGRGKVFDYYTGGYVSPRGAAGRRLLKLRPIVTLPRARPLVTLRKALGDLPSEGTHGEEPGSYARPPATAYQRRMRAGDPALRNHCAWNHGAEILEFLSRIKPGDCPRGFGGRRRNKVYFSQAYGRLHAGGLARTITTNFHNPGSGRFTHYASPRSLTLREALRLQGFHDAFHFEDTHASVAERLVGNAFPRPLARSLARHIGRLLVG